MDRVRGNGERGDTPPPSGSDVLANGVPKTGLSGASGSTALYKVEVPAGARNLVISISGGSGDVDLYTRYGAVPTTSSYDCRPYRAGNNESCTVATTQAGTYYVQLRAYQAYSGVTVKASWSTGNDPQPPADDELVNGVAKTGLSGNSGASAVYKVIVPAGVS
ncbi:MAG: PPC domain-containing protein, partial [Rhodanobacter sp.]